MWFCNRLPEESFIADICTVQLPEGNHSMVRTADILESGSVPGLHYRTQKINGQESSCRMNRNSILASMMDE